MRAGAKPCSARWIGSRCPDFRPPARRVRGTALLESSRPQRWDQRAGPTVVGRSVVFAENCVDLAASIVDDVDDALLLLRRGSVGGLRYCAE